VLKQKGEKTKFVFLSFSIFHIVRISDKLYSTTSETYWGDTWYAVTIDFSEDMFFKLLEVIPKSVANSLKQIFKGEFINAQMVNLPFPIIVGIEARLGELTSSEHEQFIPFEAIKVFKTE
jgi:hypothetical protein